MDSRLYWIWLSRALPIGDASVGALLDAFGTAASVYAADVSALRQNGFSDKVCQLLQDRSLEEARRILDRVLKAGDWILTPEDALYPVGLRRMDTRPAVLYCRGIMPDLDRRPAISVVGTRRASRDGCRDAYLLAAGLAAGGIVVVSGGAVGIDAAAHTGALDGGGITIDVMGCPLTEEYPAENTDLRHRIVAGGGLLMSEYPHGLPYQCVFQLRNRLLAGIGSGVCLAETPLRSGARITSRLAREENRDVFALPGALSGHHNDGAHSEIRRGAVLVTRASEIIEEYEPQFPGALDREAAEKIQKQLEQREVPAPMAIKPEKAIKPRKHSRRERRKSALPPTEASPTVTLPESASAGAKTVYAALTDVPCPVDLLADRTGLPVPMLLAALTELEMLGCATNSAGQQYRKS